MREWPILSHLPVIVSTVIGTRYSTARVCCPVSGHIDGPQFYTALSNVAPGVCRYKYAPLCAYFVGHMPKNGAAGL